MQLIPGPLRERLGRWLWSIILDGDLGHARGRIPPCVDQAAHKFTAWSVVEGAERHPFFGYTYAMQRRRCPTCGLTEQTALHDPARLELDR